MDSIASVSQSELGLRRKQLQRARRLRLLQVGWQTVSAGCLAWGLVWVTGRPAWVIHQPEQVVIEGNELLSARTIRSLLPVSYPQSLLRLQPEVMAKQLESQAPIAKATVSRHLFPAGLTVTVKERYPVALTVPAAAGPEAAPSNPSHQGVLDENGWWVPLKSYTSLEASLQLPALKVIGNPDQYRHEWPPLYEAVSRSPVKVSQIDWQDRANLVLKTELGTVHLGPYSSKFVEQLKVLDRMRQLPKHPRYSQIAYIDLKNPASPAVKILPDSAKAPPKAPNRSSGAR
ncbi:cell division protein FtsQ/DivIB [Kamptonema formosum]|uniref:cell division protein FtsQ/DivIB n=1 Tax=Kamptonema formosum TaxID=331992 RepID=UPI00034B1BC8|nr:FtsQ-type POTRA domain-containing protein [Oscillatoria sp. PCC 10802]